MSIQLIGFLFWIFIYVAWFESEIELNLELMWPRLWTKLGPTHEVDRTGLEDQVEPAHLDDRPSWPEQNDRAKLDWTKYPNKGRPGLSDPVKWGQTDMTGRVLILRGYVRPDQMMMSVIMVLMSLCDMVLRK